MATYAIGDLQGCYHELHALLAHIQFKPQADTLWFTGDLVNRGPESLATLRFVRDLPHKVVVLGNHDLHLLALASGAWPARKTDTLEDILTASDRDELLAWLRQQPLFHYDETLNVCLVHAGLPPQWTRDIALACAAEVEQVLRGDQCNHFLSEMYGNEPNQWSSSLAGWSRLRFITNALTRLRFCTPQGQLELATSGDLASQPPGYLPWFQIKTRAHAEETIVFGHWASLMGQVDEPHVYALDAGCVWGGGLLALRLEDKQRFSVPCRSHQQPS